MKRPMLLTSLLLGAGMVQAGEFLTVDEHAGRPYLKATLLQEKAGLAVKPLPGEKAVVVCWAERCALVRDFRVEGQDTWVSVEALARALSLQTTWADNPRRVSLSPEEEGSPSATPLAQVGQLAPNFRLRRLDGREITLAELRGKRVLINSWASW